MPSLNSGRILPDPRPLQDAETHTAVGEAQSAIVYTNESAPPHTLPDHVLVTASLILGRVAGKCNGFVPVGATHMSHSTVHLRTTGAIINKLVRDGYENFCFVTDSVTRPDVT